MREESRDRLLLWSLVAIGLLLLLSIALFTLEPGFVPAGFYEWAGSLSMGLGMLYFLGIPGLVIFVAAIGIAIKFLQYFSD